MNYIYNKSKSQNEIFDSNVKKMNEKLSDLAHEVFEKYKTEWHKFVAEEKSLKTGSWNRDDFHSQLDWSPATKRNPLPTWYKSLLKRKVNIVSGGEEVVSHDLEITFSNRKAPTLLRIKYLDNPLVYDKKLGLGWMNESGKFEKMIRTDGAKTAVSTVLRPVFKLLLTGWSYHLIKPKYTGKFKNLSQQNIFTNDPIWENIFRMYGLSRVIGLLCESCKCRSLLEGLQGTD